MDGKTLVILLCGGTKERQQDDIAAARKLWADYKGRKKIEKAKQR
jgi:putative component of toxin-antitoxin plasmid stabilization module